MELFVAFAKMSRAGFGGVLVWARRAIVDEHRWMTADEFNETFALCHFRFRRWPLQRGLICSG
jgi:chromate transporter